METPLTIDRSDLADTVQADKLAHLIIQQLTVQLPTVLPLPIEQIAKACGILEIQDLTTEGFEGGLIQDAYKANGFILVKKGVNTHRRRFTIAHELGHFVNLRHIAPQGGKEMYCTKADMHLSTPSQNSRHGIEAQANEFAANILMPQNLISRCAFMKGAPEISSILALQDLCNVSKEAAARRYLDLHGDDFAIIFTENGRLRYYIKSCDFPYLAVKKEQKIFHKTHTIEFSGSQNDISDQEETDPHWWFDSTHAQQWNLWEEVLIQANGFRMTVLQGERIDSDD